MNGTHTYLIVTGAFCGFSRCRCSMFLALVLFLHGMLPPARRAGTCAGVLQLRQAALEEALAAQSQPTPTADAGRQISAEAQDELADKLRKRQAMAKQVD